MGFHICIVVYVFGIPVLLLFREAPPYDQDIFVLHSKLYQLSTLLHVNPVNAAASRSSSLHLSFIITLTESVSFKRGELVVS